MKANYIPLDKDKHSALKVNMRHGFEFAKETHLVAATLRELAQIASCMPIVFIKDANSGSYHSIGMLGLEQNVNLYFQDDKWQSHYMPLNLQRFPFDVRPDGDKLGVFIDENSDLVSNEEGEALFAEGGEPSEFLKNRQQLLGEIANSEMANQRFIQRLVELDLIEPINMMVNYLDGNRRNVTGVYSVSEKRLNELSDEVYLELRKNGYLGAIYSILLSLSQVNRLVQLASKTDKPVRNIQISFGDQAEAGQANAEQTPTAQ